MNRFTTAQGGLDLVRFPENPRETLRAWDAADEYLLRHLDGAPGPDGSATEPVDLSGSVLVLGDRWGALATALAARTPQRPPVQVCDSYLAQQATLLNLRRNGLDADAVRQLSTQDAPPERVDVLLVRVPKSLALLEDQLHRLAPALHPGTVVLAAGMVAEIHTSTLKLFEQIIGTTRTSLAVRKARLIHCTPDPGLVRPADPWPHSYALPDGIGVLSGRTVVNHAGVFCAEHLDIGTRFFLQHLPAAPRSGGGGPLRIVDLGCGNGVVGTAAALTAPGAELTFVDESHQAVASARATYDANTGPDRTGTARFRVGDGMAGIEPGSVDLVLNNPPFHSYQASTDATAWRMFTGARQALRPGGELWVVGNRHLGYHVKLRRLFGGCQVVASDRKFVVLRAVRS
ncbi:methyltransferase [Streptacidiphilus sp. PB12-B1b]|uniref:methyltransferase n=1 Tax=Streptacidiphilus sp. PB12-B1b TaxID=2705012 RepID=UPI0015FE7A68|nr:methyltransferase [Streptacidiphilus sp. PB12-B1b]QMU76985.1 methyltransferase [Streptacidiphilus sp. PB12-B1b]